MATDGKISPDSFKAGTHISITGQIMISKITSTPLSVAVFADSTRFWDKKIPLLR